MIDNKSPFYVIQNFISNKEAADLAKATRVEPILNDDGALDSMVRSHTQSETFLFERMKKIIPELEEHFGLKYKGTESIAFQQFPVSNGKNAEDPQCYNAVYKRKKWVRINDRALTAAIWFKDYEDQPPFNMTTQVYGGKLEFPVYNFGFQPQAGTLVVYPACERFISLITSIQVGELQMARIHMHAEGIWIYNPADFPGDYRTWFNFVI